MQVTSSIRPSKEPTVQYIAFVCEPAMAISKKSRVAVVTGANKGVGLEIVRKLALASSSEGSMSVILTARDEGRGQEARQSLLLQQGLGNNNMNLVVFRKLDIGSVESRTEFANWIREAYGGLDILVNNGAVFLDDNVYENAVECMKINYRGTVELTRMLVPLMRASPAGARIVTVNSIVGRLQHVHDEGLRKKLADVNQYDQQFLDKLEQEFLEVCKAGDGGPNSYSNTAYRFSKLLLNCYTRLLAHELSSRPQGHKIYVHNASPGFPMTDMHRHFWRKLDEETYQEHKASGKFQEMGAVTVEEGADTTVWLCLLPPEKLTPSGLFWENRQLLSY